MMARPPQFPGGCPSRHAGPCANRLPSKLQGGRPSRVRFQTLLNNNAPLAPAAACPVGCDNLKRARWTTLWRTRQGGPHMAINTIAAVIPLYNKEPYVARAIGSILAQTKPVDEIIIVDDASTDGSLERLKAFQDSRIRVLRRTDPQQRGLPATRNLGIRSAASRWIALLDADDRWHEDFIEENEKLIAQASDRTGFLFTGWETVWADGHATRDAYSARRDREGFARLDLHDFISTWLHLGACPLSP